jgi:regulator of protease activity HflC (stomatin/prohibitin superfamily)
VDLGNLGPLLVLGAAAGGVALLAWLARHPWEIVQETEHALHYRDGALVGVAPTGRRRYDRRRDLLLRVDNRAHLLTLPGQEVLTSDGVPVKVSLLASVRVTDPVRALHASASWFDAAYASLQVALREVLSSATVDEALAGRATLGDATAERARAGCELLGLDLEQVSIKDLMLPGPVRDLFAKVVTARKEAEASLERARGETAALRSLANAARLVRDQPELLHLRALEAAAGGTSTTVVLDTSGGTSARRSSDAAASDD